MENGKLITMDSSDLYKKYLDTALHFLSFRPRSEKEVRDNLIKKKAPMEIIEQVITRLKVHRFVNDEEFVRWWIEQRSKFRPKGMRIIKLELKHIIENAMVPQETDEPSSDNDLVMAKKIVEKKLPKYKGMEKREIYQKLGAYLARKGFDWDTIKKVIDDVLTGNY